MGVLESGKKIARKILPTALWDTCDVFIVSYRSRGLRYAVQRAIMNRNALFSGDDALFLDLSKRARVYIEYGAGASTEHMLKMDNCVRVVSVETSPEWAQKVCSFSNDGSPALTVLHIDLGPVGMWGRPLTPPAPEAVLEYVEAPFAVVSSEEVGLVLIDGRYRVAAFLTAMARLPAGTPVLFDDYYSREGYHVVEEFYKPARRCGRQALFVAPGPGKNYNVAAMRDTFLRDMN